MKKHIALLIVLLLPAALLAGCAQTAPPAAEKRSIVCTVFPQYDWVRQILGEELDGMEVTFLLNKRADLHNYQPTMPDFAQISACDLFVYVGGESEDWAGKALAQAANKNMKALSLLETLGAAAKEEALLEGMAEDDHEGHDHADQDEHEDAIAYDEHVWLSLKNAQLFCAAIAEEICALDPENAETYRANLAAYTAELAALDAEYEAAVAAAERNTLLVADRFPFRYMADDYGLECFAAFPGCSAETEAGFGTLIGLVKKLDELDLHTVLVTESSDQALAQKVIGDSRAKDQQILVLDAIQSVTTQDVADGTTYLSIMENNLAVLKEALR